MLKVSQANEEISSTLANAKSIGELSNTTKIQSQNILNESYALIEKHEKFLNPSGVQSVDIAEKVDAVILCTKYLSRRM